MPGPAVTGWSRPQISANCMRETLGLAGAGPWPIVLAGYLLNAMMRLEAEIRDGPYRPQPGDEYYPARRVPGAA